MQELEKAFFVKQSALHPKVEKSPTETQKDLLLSQLRLFYSDMSEREALEMLIKLSRQSKPPRTIPMEKYLTNSPNALKFWNYCQRWNFIGFSFPEIAVTEEGKKVPVKFPQWHNITRENFTGYIEPDHFAFAFLTGQVSGITVIDCDTKEVYHDLITEFPELKKTLTVITRKGAHIYCRYTSTVLTGTKIFSRFPNVDIRNDNALVFSPPTFYSCRLQGAGGVSGEKTIYEFVDISAPIISFPEQLVKEVSDTKKVNSERSISCVNDLTQKELREILKLFRTQPWIIKRTPVISNALFEIGYHPLAKSAAKQKVELGDCYYMKMFELMVIVVSHGNWDVVLKTLNQFSNHLTFDVYKTAQGHYRLYCVSVPLFPRDDLTVKLQTVFRADPETAQFPLLNGWTTPLTGHEVKETKIGRFGNAPVIDDFILLLDLKDSLMDLFSDVTSLGVDQLRNSLTTMTFPKFQQFLPFISFPPNLPNFDHGFSPLGPPPPDHDKTSRANAREILPS